MMSGTQQAPFVIWRLPDDCGASPVYLAEPALLTMPRAMAMLRYRSAVEARSRGQLAQKPWLLLLDPAQSAAILAILEGHSGAAAPAQSPAARPGSRYELGPLLGTGGTAEVFQGTVIGAEGFARPVAIKRVLAVHSGEPRFAAMFIEEARIASQLSHPNVVSVLDFDRDSEGRLFLVMELVAGKDLAALCRAKRPPPSISIFLASEILRGLGYAHELPHACGVRGYVHRDVSPHNVLVSWEGAVKVSDFGIAKALERPGGVRSGSVNGKPAYMSPEQVNGEALDGRSDLFSVGVILWELLAGTKLFAGGVRETFARILFNDIPRPSRLATGVPLDLEAVAMRLLARDREGRYPTAEAAIEALARCAANPRNGRSELVRWMARQFPAEARSRAKPPRAKRPRRRRRSDGGGRGGGGGGGRRS
ncbi:MAG TPA: serine/threonine-protein kinase [Kofleriaceae bacterium]|nr:serine/threonine-protein kinase [Kofleriaceae bacterium]